MTCMLKSIFRMDEDQCARRNAQRYLKIVDPDYYEFETHILIDDAFDVNGRGVFNLKLYFYRLWRACN
jgi:chitin synthase